MAATMLYSFLSSLINFIVRLSYKTKDGNASLNAALLQRGLVLHHKTYYAPFVAEEDLGRPLSEERHLPGIELDVSSQKEFLKNFCYERELLSFPLADDRPLQYAYSKGMFGPGDAEILYGMVRYLKPKRIIEIGAGSSTLVVQEAIKRNAEESSGYGCVHTCIEPYENPWLEHLDVIVVRERVESIPLTFFGELTANDILFVDSSHVVKPQGDVLYEVLELYGSLNLGVYIHVHDIFHPRDYPREWIIDHRRLWHEQYLLEAFLSFNPKFEIVCALNWLWNSHPDVLVNACPVLTGRTPNNPGSFWFKRV